MRITDFGRWDTIVPTDRYRAIGRIRPRTALVVSTINLSGNLSRKSQPAQNESRQREVLLIASTARVKPHHTESDVIPTVIDQSGRHIRRI
jgi:hypothetical protein